MTADPFDKDRTGVPVGAIREYVKEAVGNETFQELVAARYCDGQLEPETARQLVGAETAQRLRLPKADLEAESLDFTMPIDTNIYGGDATAADTTDGDER